MFTHYIGIDYSGAKTADTGLPGLRVYKSSTANAPREVLPTQKAQKYWTRRSLCAWLAAYLETNAPALVGIDHGFSFPLSYFKTHNLPCQWPMFLDDFQQYWPTDMPGISVEMVRKGLYGQGKARFGNSRWRRMTEERVKAKSVFHFDVPGSVAKSTHAGLPWLRWLHKHLQTQIHFWPYQGLDIPPGKSVIAEAYPSLWNTSFPQKDRTSDQHDAYVVSKWLRTMDTRDQLFPFFHPEIEPAKKEQVHIEGWILGVL